MRTFPPLNVTLGPDGVAIVVHVTPEQYAEMQEALRNENDLPLTSPTVRLMDALSDAVRSQIPEARIAVQVNHFGLWVKEHMKP